MSMKWVERDGIIRLAEPLVSDGTTGEAWIRRSHDKGMLVDAYVRSILRSRDFVPSPAGTPYNVAVLMGSSFAGNALLISAYIRAEAGRSGLVKAHPELACLLWDKFTFGEIRAMGLWRIVVMHDSIKDSGGIPSLLGADRNEDGTLLCAYYDIPDRGWNRVNGFAFLQV